MRQKDPDTSRFISLLEAGLILTENILDHIQGVDAPDIVAKGPLMMRANPCAARLPGSGAAVGRAATRGHGSEHHVFLLS